MKFLLLACCLILAGCKKDVTILAPPANPVQINTIANRGKQYQLARESLTENNEWLPDSQSCAADIIPNFEKPVEYLDEACAEDSLKCVENCRQKDGNACYSLALFIQTQADLADQNVQRLFMRACQFGITSGCTNFAAGKFRLEPDKPDSVKCSAETFEKTCAKNDAWGCTMFGLVLWKGLGHKKDPEGALKILPKACAIFADDVSCENAREMEKQIISEKEGQKTANSQFYPK